MALQLLSASRKFVFSKYFDIDTATLKKTSLEVYTNLSSLIASFSFELNFVCWKTANVIKEQLGNAKP
jgi:hypothetical protein